MQPNKPKPIDPVAAGNSARDALAKQKAAGRTVRTVGRCDPDQFATDKAEQMYKDNVECKEDIFQDVTERWLQEQGIVTELDDKNGTLRQAVVDKPLPARNQPGIMRSGQKALNIKNTLDQREQDAKSAARRAAMGDNRAVDESEDLEESYMRRLNHFLEEALDTER